jgi:hypothetical protein
MNKYQFWYHMNVCTNFEVKMMKRLIYIVQIWEFSSIDMKLSGDVFHLWTLWHKKYQNLVTLLIHACMMILCHHTKFQNFRTRFSYIYIFKKSCKYKFQTNYHKYLIFGNLLWIWCLFIYWFLNIFL